MKAIGIAFFIIFFVCGCASPNNTKVRLQIQTRECEKEALANSVRDFRIPFVAPKYDPNEIGLPDWRRNPARNKH
jgi:hypothetical protein